MITAADYLELADDFDRIFTALTEAKGHAASVGIELPQLVHYAYPVLGTLPGTLRQASKLHEVDPVQARALPAVDTSPLQRHDEPEDQ